MESKSMTERLKANICKVAKNSGLLKKIDRHEWEYITDQYDFEVHYDLADRIYILDIFDHNVKDNEVYVENFEIENLIKFEGGYTMAGNIVTFLVGVVCIVLGISNMRGNISSLHSYHRSRVSEEDRIPFGKQVGLGTIIVGIGIIVFSVLSSVTLYTENDIFILVGTAVLIIGIILGLVISFRAMIKYNKGIF